MTVLDFADVTVCPADPRTPGGPAAPPRRSGRGTILLPPWTRAPLLAFRQPAVILAVVAAAAILACAVSSASLFLSSSSSEALQRIIAARCPDASYPVVSLAPRPTVTVNQAASARQATELPDIATLEREVPAAMTGAGLPPPNRTIIQRSFPAATNGRTSQGMRLFYGDGALDNITVRERIPGRGMMVPTAAAAILSVRAGDTLTFSGVPVKVVGVYTNLFDEPLRPYWCSYVSLGLTPCDTCSSDPPPLGIFTDAETFDDVYRRVVRAGGTLAAQQMHWLSPIDTDHITLSQARHIIDQQNGAYRALGLSLSTQVTPADNQGQLPDMAAQASRIRSGLSGPVVPIALGGALLALLLVGAAGSYWADRRAREVRLLSSRGVGPVGLAVKAALELTLPAIVGTVLGWLLARWLVAVLGPSPDLDPAAPRSAVLTAAGGLLAGIVLLSAVAGLRARNATERPVGARRPRLAFVPWELVLLGAAALCYLRLRGGNAVTLDHDVAQVNLLLVAMPLLFLLGTAVLAVRLLTLLLRPLRRGSHNWPVPLYLAVSRITAAPVVSVTLLAALAMPIAMVVYSAGVTQTSQYTIDAKAEVFIGSNTAVISVDKVRRTPELDRVATVVERYDESRLGRAGEQATVLAIDPATLPRHAFWDQRFADQSLSTLMSRLSAAPRDGRLPALLVNADSTTDTSSVRVGAQAIPLDVVGKPRVFPGMHLHNPLVVVNRAALGDRTVGAQRYTELWTTGGEVEVERAVEAQHTRVFRVNDMHKVFDVANYLAVTWSFGYLEALAALVGLIAIGGLLLYLETRARSRAASYALSLRMGLTPRRHLRSMLCEMGMVVGAALVIGTVLAYSAVLLVYGRMDLDVTRPPAPLLTSPVTAIAGSAAAAVVVAVLAAAYAHHSARRTDVSEVLRLGV